jgi:hypothetical protein
MSDFTGHRNCQFAKDITHKLSIGFTKMTEEHGDNELIHETKQATVEKLDVRLI